MLLNPDCMAGSRVVASLLILACVSSAFVVAQTPHAGAVTIDANFPGGNVTLIKVEGHTVHLAPDLRGDSPWFYWYFEAKSSQPGRVNFVFPEKVAGFENGAIEMQGPAISSDQGRTWTWMGTESVAGNAFYFDFAKREQRVRFAVTIPYVQADLDEFLARNTGNPHLTRSVLTRSRHGREVDLLRIGKPGPDVKAVLVTGRHHAAETIASYVLEGFLQAAMADNPAGQAFRRKYGQVMLQAWVSAHFRPADTASEAGTPPATAP